MFHCLCIIDHNIAHAKELPQEKVSDDDIPSQDVKKNQTGHRMHLEGPQISQIHPLKIIAFRKCHGIWICMGVLCHCREQLNDVKIWIPMPIYPTWCSFPFGQSKFWQKYLGKSGPYMLIHFQYEAVSASWSRKKRPVFHRQTPPEYHKIAKKKYKRYFNKYNCC